MQSRPTYPCTRVTTGTTEDLIPELELHPLLSIQKIAMRDADITDELREIAFGADPAPDT